MIQHLQHVSPSSALYFLSSNLWHHLPTLSSSFYFTELIHKSHGKKTSINPTYHINSEPLMIIAQHSFFPLMKRNAGCSYLMFKHTTFSLWTLLKKFTIERPPFHHKLFPSTQSLPLWHKTRLLCFPSSSHFFPNYSSSHFFCSEISPKHTWKVMLSFQLGTLNQFQLAVDKDFQCLPFARFKHDFSLPLLLPVSCTWHFPHSF